MSILVREIPGYPGYWATNEGTIISQRTGTVLRPRAHYRTGHLRVRVYGNQLSARLVTHSGTGRPVACRFADVFVHKLVCLAWHGPPPSEDAMVLHYDDNPENNVPSNLRWGTRKQNAEDRLRNVTTDADGFDWAVGEQSRTADLRVGGST